MRKAKVAIIIALLTTSVFAFADTATLNPTDDAAIRQRAPDHIYGDDEYFPVGYYEGYISSLIRFDLSPYAGSTIDSAYLRLYAYGAQGTFPPTNIKLGRNTADWSEDTVTWNNRPGYTDYFVIDSPSSLFEWWVTDVTGYIRGFIGGSYDNYGFRIGKGDTDESIVNIRSKEYSESTYLPQLLINYTQNPVESESLGNIKAAFK